MMKVHHITEMGASIELANDNPRQTSKRSHLRLFQQLKYNYLGQAILPHELSQGEFRVS